jgi:hypothetical protein
MVCQVVRSRAATPAFDMRLTSQPLVFPVRRCYLDRRLRRRHRPHRAPGRSLALRRQHLDHQQTTELRQRPRGTGLPAAGPPARSSAAGASAAAAPAPGHEVRYPYARTRALPELPALSGLSSILRATSVARRCPDRCAARSRSSCWCQSRDAVRSGSPGSWACSAQARTPPRISIGRPRSCRSACPGSCRACTASRLRAIGTRQHDPRPHGESLRRLRPTRPPNQRLPLVVRRHERTLRSTATPAG